MAPSPQNSFYLVAGLVQEILKCSDDKLGEILQSKGVGTDRFLPEDFSTEVVEGLLDGKEVVGVQALCL